jgi:enoyl-CoA hydratase
MSAASHHTGTGKLHAEVDDDGIARVTFDDPPTRNALSLEVRTALPPLLDALEHDPAVRVVIVTGAGGQFVSGADISEFDEQRATPEARARYDALADEVDRAWAALTTPVIAAVRGWCLGGGLLTALQADLRVAADDARFGVPAARLGIGFRLAGIEALVALIGPSRTADLVLTARRCDAAEALAMGLVDRVVPADRLDEEATGLARAIAANAPLTVAASTAGIRAVARSASVPAAERARVSAMVEACFRSEDYVEGRRAFAEKRPPRFRGR